MYDLRAQINKTHIYIYIYIYQVATQLTLRTI